MKKVYILEESSHINTLKHKIYEDLLDLLKNRQPEITCLSEHEELFQLRHLLLLLKLGFLKVEWIQNFDKGILVLEIVES